MDCRFLYALIVPAVACSCGHTKPEVDNTTYELLADSVRQNLTLDTVTTAHVYEELTLNGSVTFDQEKVAQVVPVFGGTALRVYAGINDYVEKGAVLATVKSGEAADYGKQIVIARQQLAVAQRSLEATRKMYDAGMASGKELLQARQDVAEAEAEIRRQKEIAGIYHLDNNSTYQIKAPASGFIIERNINPGTLFRSDQGEPVFTITGLSDIWVMADVYEGDISKVKEGLPVEITTLAYPDEVFKGKIDKVYNVLDDESKTMKVRIRLANKDFRLKPGMFANVCVRHELPGAKQLRIPSHALVFEDGSQYVVVVGKGGRMTVRRVEVGFRQGGNAYISSGLHSGETVVDKNVLLVYNALKSK